MTKPEEKRVEIFKKKSNQLKVNGYLEEDCTISMRYVYLVGLLLTLPFCALFFCFFMFFIGKLTWNIMASSGL